MITDNELKSLIDSVVFDLRILENSIKDNDKAIEQIKKIQESLNDIQNCINNKEFLNVVKRLLYKRMINCKDTNPELNKQIYIIYQDLKDGKINAEHALNNCNSLILNQKLYIVHNGLYC